MTNAEITFDSNSASAQGIVGRLAISYLTGDVTASAVAFLDIASDPRGVQIASSEVITALLDGLVQSWLQSVPAADLITRLRSQLAAIQLEESEE